MLHGFILAIWDFTAKLKHIHLLLGKQLALKIVFCGGGYIFAAIVASDETINT